MKVIAAKIAIIAVHHTTTDREACIESLRGNRQDEPDLFEAYHDNNDAMLS